MKLNFAHNYAKLKHKQYTTIRGKSKALALKVGQRVEVTVNRQPVDAAWKKLCLGHYIESKHSARDSNPLHPARDNKEYEQEREGGKGSE